MKKNLPLNKLLLSLIFVAAISCVSYAQNKSSCAEFQKLIGETYNFKPSKLTADERQAKSVALDAVWEKVKTNQKELLPCLRATIEAPKADKFFNFDASNLLIRYDRTDEAKKILIKAYAEVDFADVNLQYWMRNVARLGFEGFDTSAAGESWLNYSNAQYSSSQHGALVVSQGDGALIIYGSMDEKIATPALAKIAAQENNPAREIAVRGLLDQATPEAFQQLRKLNRKGLSENGRRSIDALLTKPNLLQPREGTPKITRREYLDAFRQLVAGKPDTFLELTIKFPDGDSDAVAVMKPEDIPLIRKARRYFAATATPHSAEWYESFTGILLALIWKPELIEQKA